MTTERPDDAVYLDAILGNAVRVLGLMDREPLSATRGCMDRTFWAWKFTDFPGARFQEGLCVLSFLNAVSFEENRYHGRLGDWIAGGFDYWAAIQRPGGDFDEAYPYERSLAATAFTSFYLSEAWSFLEGDLPAATADRFRRALTRAADWLVRNEETHGFLSNHLAAAAAALQHAYRITGEARFELRARHFIGQILDHQSSEGWYEEYGGADPGYQSHGSFYLARYLELQPDSDLMASLERATRFLAHFVHPDRSIGGEYASRNTQTYYPAAFEMLAGHCGAARWIAREMRQSVTDLSAAGLASVDAYNLFPLLNNYVFAHLGARRNAAGGVAEELPERVDCRYFPEAGVLKVCRPRYDLYVGVGKGGVVKLFDRERRQLVLSDCGYLGRLRSGKLISTQWADPCRDVQIDDQEVRVEGGFYEVSRPLMSPATFIGFRLTSLTLGRVPGLARWLKALLVRVLIHRRRELPIRLSRRVRFRSDGIDIEDRLCGPGGERIDRLVQADVFTTIHMGSSRYFVPNEISASSRYEPDGKAEVDLNRLHTGVDRRRSVTLD